MNKDRRITLNLNKNTNKSRVYDYSCGIHEGTSPCDQSPQLVPRRVYTKGLVSGTCLMNKNSNQFEFEGLVAGTKLCSLRLDFKAKMATSYDGTCPSDLSKGLVAGTSLLVCADLRCCTTA